MKEIEVAAGLVFAQEKLLITRRYANSHLGGLWEFPGGKREPGESFSNCLARELREELGIGVEVGEELETILHHYPEKSVLLKFFKCRLVDGAPQPLGCPEFAWVGREDLSRYEFPAADAQLLARLRADAALWA